MGKVCHTMSGYLLALLLVFAHGETPAAAERGELTAEEAAALVQRQTGGQALEVKSDSRDGRRVYRVRILTPDGRVRVITVDAGRSRRR
ncbi:MAG: hypothetical protein Kow006_02590 [Gammaproteobacteria bacterium]